jgi:hypothetical protein
MASLSRFSPLIAEDGAPESAANWRDGMPSVRARSAGEGQAVDNSGYDRNQTYGETAGLSAYSLSELE